MKLTVKDKAMTTEQVNAVIRLNNQMTGLLEECKKALSYEHSKYHLFADPGTLPFKRYFLYEIGTGKQLCYGPMERINSFIRIRNLNHIFIDI